MSNVDLAFQNVIMHALRFVAPWPAEYEYARIMPLAFLDQKLFAKKCRKRLFRPFLTSRAYLLKSDQFWQHANVGTDLGLPHTSAFFSRRVALRYDASGYNFYIRWYFILDVEKSACL